jgi:glucose-1-phosphate thymidylyltransferase
MKGIILAGGSGTRLHPVTAMISKQLLPIYDKPMIYYPLSALMLAGIREILVISTPEDTPRFQQLLGDGSQWGLSLQYAVQPSPDGLAQAFLIGKSFWPVKAAAWRWATICSTDMTSSSRCARLPRTSGATVFAYPVNDPQRYGVVEFNAESQGHLARRKAGRSALTLRRDGNLFYDKRIVSVAESIQTLSARRTGNHGRQPLVSGAQRAAGGDPGPRHGVAGYRNARCSARSFALYPHH